MKRIISLLAAFAMIFAIAAIPAMAADLTATSNLPMDVASVGTKNKGIQNDQRVVIEFSRALTQEEMDAFSVANISLKFIPASNNGSNPFNGKSYNGANPIDPRAIGYEFLENGKGLRIFPMYYETDGETEEVVLSYEKNWDAQRSYGSCYFLRLSIAGISISKDFYVAMPKDAKFLPIINPVPLDQIITLSGDHKTNQFGDPVQGDRFYFSSRGDSMVCTVNGQTLGNKDTSDVGYGYRTQNGSHGRDIYIHPPKATGWIPGTEYTANITISSNYYSDFAPVEAIKTVILDETITFVTEGEAPAGEDFVVESLNDGNDYTVSITNNTGADKSAMVVFASKNSSGVISKVAAVPAATLTAAVAYTNAFAVNDGETLDVFVWDATTLQPLVNKAE